MRQYNVPSGTIALLDGRRLALLEALNDWLEQRCRELWQQIPHGLRPGTIEDMRAEEARFLMPMPRLFDGFVEYTKRVSPTCLVHLERNRYSEPASFANRPVSLRVYPERIVGCRGGVAHLRGPRPHEPHANVERYDALAKPGRCASVMILPAAPSSSCSEA
ncbi:transposase [Mesorhizobium japonicum MAFF 303099]|uniref:Transposase n=1 Tax=Mesorhizobium japonicum (strain LMG 29417 / CECT 9101 / MAFF 303099) TaxID=266835 RepID=Q98AA1_RHILO|nr:transposase [Mesorhizobium japonicum MAFF 303099]